MPTGWAIPPGSRTAHFYVGAWSLCRRLAPAPTVLSELAPTPSCGACRKAAALRARLVGVQRVELVERPAAPVWTPPPGPRPLRQRHGSR